MEHRLARQEAGATLIEHVLVIALVAIAGLGAWTLLGDAVDAKVDCAASAIAGGGGGAPCGASEAGAIGAASAGEHRASLEIEPGPAGARLGLSDALHALESPERFALIAGSDGTISRADLERALSSSDDAAREAAVALLGSPSTRYALDVGAGRGHVDDRISAEDVAALAGALRGASGPADVAAIFADTAAGRGGRDRRWSADDLETLAKDRTMPRDLREWARSAEPNATHGCGWFRVDCHVAHAVSAAIGTDAFRIAWRISEDVNVMLGVPPLDPRKWGDFARPRWAYLRGAAEGAYGVAYGTYFMVRHPILTAKGIYALGRAGAHYVTHPSEIDDLVVSGARGVYGWWSTASPEERAHTFGKIGGTVAGSIALGYGVQVAKVALVTRFPALGKVPGFWRAARIAEARRVAAAQEVAGAAAEPAQAGTAAQTGSTVAAETGAPEVRTAAAAPAPSATSAPVAIPEASAAEIDELIGTLKQQVGSDAWVRVVDGHPVMDEAYWSTLSEQAGRIPDAATREALIGAHLERIAMVEEAPAWGRAALPRDRQLFRFWVANEAGATSPIDVELQRGLLSEVPSGLYQASPQLVPAGRVQLTADAQRLLEPAAYRARMNALLGAVPAHEYDLVQQLLSESNAGVGRSSLLGPRGGGLTDAQYFDDFLDRASRIEDARARAVVLDRFLRNQSATPHTLPDGTLVADVYVARPGAEQLFSETRRVTLEAPYFRGDRVLGWDLDPRVVEHYRNIGGSIPIAEADGTLRATRPFQTRPHVPDPSESYRNWHIREHGRPPGGRVQAPEPPIR